MDKLSRAVSTGGIVITIVRALIVVIVFSQATSTTSIPSATWMRRALLVALACYLGGRLGLAIPRLDAQVSLMWPPSGIALAAAMVPPNNVANTSCTTRTAPTNP